MKLRNNKLLISILLAFCLAQGQRQTVTIPAIPFTTPITAFYQSSPSIGFDAFHLSALNSTSFQWWYFDIIPGPSTCALHQDIALTIVFYATTDFAFPRDPPSDLTTVVNIEVRLPNGAQWSQNLAASEAVIVSENLGASGDWKGSGASFSGCEEAKIYTINIDNEAEGVKGTVKLKSRATPHYACNLAGSEMDMQVVPGFGWANAVPDADASVDVEVAGYKLKFDGVGYHDQNWANHPVVDNLQSWYWGHGRIGEYSVVWFDFLPLVGGERAGAYLSKNGKILTNSCAAGASKVRPFGGDDTYPPTVFTEAPAGFNIEFDLGEKECFNATVTTDKLVYGGSGGYARWMGEMRGSLNGGQEKTGVAMFEQIAVTGE